MSPEGRKVLEAAAVIGFRIDPWLLAHLISARTEAIKACLAIGILRTQGDVFTFRHELSRDAIYQSPPLPRKQALHQQVLEALRDASPT